MKVYHNFESDDYTEMHTNMDEIKILVATKFQNTSKSISNEMKQPTSDN